MADLEVGVGARAAGLPRTLGLWSAVALVVGVTIGSGIFRTPAVVAQRVPHPEALLLLWALGGGITLCGALSIGELASAIPATGGLYAFLREGWGRLAAFLFGWSELVLIRANALGGIAIVFGEYLLRSIGVDPLDHGLAARALAAGAIAFAAAVNVRGARLGALVVSVATWAKFGALALLAAGAFAFGGSHGASVSNLTTGSGATLAAGGMGLALVSILWAYDGWADLSFAAGEVKRPQTILPRAIILGTLAIVVIYMLTNAAYLYVTPVEEIAASRLVAADTMRVLLGRAGVVLVSIFVMISAFSSLNGSMLASPRIFFAMADDGLLFATMGRVHQRYRTPYVAILFSAVLGMALVMSRNFEAITNTFVLAVWPFYALSVAAIFRLRRTRPDLPRPYRAAGYPLVPAIFVVAVAAFVVNALVQEPVPTSITFALILAGAPVYFIVDRRARR
ncbi:MAG: amino acid permease [Acidobacteria bacterium]|nr:amino acid permease [Acidobacteriota bacterium]